MPTATAGQTNYVDPAYAGAPNTRPISSSRTSTPQATMSRPLGTTTTSAPMAVATNTRSVVSSRTNFPQLQLLRGYNTVFFPTSTSTPRPRSTAGLLYPAQG